MIVLSRRRVIFMLFLTGENGVMLQPVCRGKPEDFSSRATMPCVPGGENRIETTEIPSENKKEDLKN
jgi:hypothetical protein